MNWRLCSKLYNRVKTFYWLFSGCFVTKKIWHIFVLFGIFWNTIWHILSLWTWQHCYSLKRGKWCTDMEILQSDWIPNFFINSIYNPYPKIKNYGLRYPIQIWNRPLSGTLSKIFGSVNLAFSQTWLVEVVTCQVWYVQEDKGEGLELEFRFRLVFSSCKQIRSH